MTQEPNFFVIGAPKSGTTSLCYYLDTHPRVTFSRPKEPNFFNTDHAIHRIRNYADYLSCFSHGTEQTEATGEGSVLYLSSRYAVQNIIERYPDARFIVMLRNPIDAAYSCHGQGAFHNGEYAMGFEQAWRAQESFENQEDAPASIKFIQRFRYSDLYRYAPQIERLLSFVARDKVHIAIYDDFAADTETAFNQVLDFLSVERAELASYPAMNKGRVPRSVRFEKILLKLGNAKRKIGVTHSFGIIPALRDVNTSPGERPPLRPEFRAELENFFAADVARTAASIGVDLSGWIPDATATQDEKLAPPSGADTLDIGDPTRKFGRS